MSHKITITISDETYNRLQKRREYEKEFGCRKINVSEACERGLVDELTTSY